MKFSNKLTLSIILVAIVAVPILGFTIFYTSRNILKVRIVEDQLKLVQHTMDKIDRVLYEAYQDIQLIAEDEVLEEFLEIYRPVADQVIPETLKRAIEEMIFLTGPWDIPF